MNEVKWDCPYCMMYHVGTADGIIEPNTIIQCSYCKKKVIVSEITYILQTRQPE